MPFYEYTCKNHCCVKDLYNAYNQLLENHVNDDSLIPKLKELQELKVNFGYGYDQDYPDRLRRNYDAPKSEHTLVWEKHKMISDSDIESCPVCDGETIRLIASSLSATYIRGNGYLDKTGARRDMDKFTLQNNDPYSHMREPGEKEHLLDKLSRAGKEGFDENGNRTAQHYGPK